MSEPNDWRERLLADLGRAFDDDGRGQVSTVLAHARRVHLAIMREPWASYVADGSKRVESRWGAVKCAPHGDISAGDVIAWKRTGGPVYGVSCVSSVETHVLRDDRDIADAVARCHAEVCISNDPAPYAGKRVLTLIRVGPFSRLPSPIDVRQPGRAGWVVVRDRGALFGGAS